MEIVELVLSNIVFEEVKEGKKKKYRKHVEFVIVTSESEYVKLKDNGIGKTQKCNKVKFCIPADGLDFFVSKLYEAADEKPTPREWDNIHESGGGEG